jgi:hypothetical protein
VTPSQHALDRLNKRLLLDGWETIHPMVPHDNRRAFACARSIIVLLNEGPDVFTATGYVRSIGHERPEPSPLSSDFLSGIQDEPDAPVVFFRARLHDATLHVTGQVANEETQTADSVETDMSFDAFCEMMVNKTEAAVAARVAH